METYGVQCKDESQVLTIFFPTVARETVATTKKFDFTGKDVIDLGQCGVEFYKTYPFNEHHPTTKSMYEVALPLLASKIKTFPYNRDDFDLIPFFARNGKYDVSYLKPKKDFCFTIQSKGRVLDEHCGFMEITNINEMHPDNLATDNRTEYHRLFRGAHTCSVITNETVANNNKIFISGDSMDIPLIPVLACYYNEVVFMDNRDGKSHKDYYKDKVFDAVIFSCFEGHSSGTTFGSNLL